MTTVSNEMVEFAKKELTSIIMRLVSTIEESNATQISNDIVKVIDWNNSALMHKGLSWMAKNYLIQQNIISL
ncbi:MAG: hypothetical protein K2L07_16820 [Lachnospiraceae bacterium]|nr:hypothetical protein [Lachnospiraceae bacterium]